MKKSVSIIKEKRSGEKRAIIVPEQVQEFRLSNFDVYVEESTGIEIGFSDEEYIKYGAKILNTKEAWSASPFVLKYKPPIEDEYRFLKPHMHLCAIFHAEGDMKLVETLKNSMVSAYSYEFFKSTNGTFPLAIIGGEIAGKLAVIYGAYHLQSQNGGSGILLSSLANIRRPKVLIIGYGNAGGAAARLAHDLGCEVVVLGRDIEKMRRFESNFNQPIRTELNTSEKLSEELKDTDLVIGTILISTYDTEPMITEEHLKKMKKGSMIIDVTCGYGKGYLPTFDYFTNENSPTFIKQGIVHCKIDRLPAFVPKTSSIAFSKNATPYLINLGNAIYNRKLVDSTSQNGLIIQGGEVIHNEIKKHVDLIKYYG